MFFVGSKHMKARSVSLLNFSISYTPGTANMYSQSFFASPFKKSLFLNALSVVR